MAPSSINGCTGGTKGSKGNSQLQFSIVHPHVGLAPSRLLGRGSLKREPLRDGMSLA
ncbi:hypothetical protein LZ30DRAFT_719581 [Colletotrichum cereale]|nr:hypothetical protein LZ30DRAFT_719581 [Colletotrichum cereale]